MSKWPRFLLGVMVVVSSLAVGPVPSAPGVAQAPRPTTEQILQELGGVPCPNDSDFTCVTLTVPLDHFNPTDTRTLDVVFGVLPAAARNRRGMFVTATGGPGYSGLDAADSYTSGFDKRIPRRFDIVFFDQRGIANSGGLECPAATNVYYQADFQTSTPEQEAAAKQVAQTFAQDCVAEMGNPESLPYLGTAQAVEDLELFRQLMQDEKFWLYGESYGTQYAQTYAAVHGDRLNGLILDGTVDLTLDGFQFYRQQAQAFADVLGMTLAACADDPACLADMKGDPQAAYDQLARRLGRQPQTFRFPLPSGGTERRELTLTDLETVVGGQVYGESDRMLLNRALAAFANRGDLVPLARLLYVNLGVDPVTLETIPDPTYSEAMYYAVECQDYFYPGATPEEKADNYLRAGDAVEAALPRLASFFYGDLPCAYWPAPANDPARPAPLAAEGIPTFVLGATADPATPVGNGLAVYSRLSDGYLYTQQGGPHVIFGRGNECPDKPVSDFLVNGRLPRQREHECEGYVTDDYVPLTPARANGFADVEAGLAAAETEITYLPEYWYWYGDEPVSAGCPFGGAIDFDTDDDLYTFALKDCAFTQNFVMNGTGSYDPDRDRFILDVALAGRWRCTPRYVRTGDNVRVMGNCP